MSQQPRTPAWGTARLRPGRPSSTDRNLGMNQALTALSYLVGGVIVYGGIGWLVGRWLHLQLLTGVGIVVGSGLAIYLIVQRLGRPGDAAVESWIEQKKAREADWARRAGRPEPRARAARAQERKDHLT